MDNHISIPWASLRNQQNQHNIIQTNLQLGLRLYQLYPKSFPNVHEHVHKIHLCPWYLPIQLGLSESMILQKLIMLPSGDLT